MPTETLLWWSALSAVAAFNITTWALAAARARRGRVHEPDLWPVRRLQILLSCGYVLGCAYRSVLPVYDMPRQTLVDSWWSSVIVGRSVATVAELCFAAQWAALLHRVAATTGSAAGRALAAAVLPLIATAEICSWHAVLTTSNLGHVFEESLWALAATLVAVGIVSVRPRASPEMRRALLIAGVAALGYVAYMVGVDVPTYWERWLAEQANGHRPLDLLQGVVDASSRWVVTHRWSDWRGEVIWMTLYFSVAVWLSIALVHVPLPRVTGRGPAGVGDLWWVRATAFGPLPPPRRISGRTGRTR